jgi:hypothetical protein
LLGFGGEQAVIEDRGKHAALQRILAIIAGVVEEDAANGAGLADDRDFSEHQAAGHDRLLEMRPCPRLERIVPERFQERDQPQGFGARHRRGRTESAASFKRERTHVPHGRHPRS